MNEIVLATLVMVAAGVAGGRAGRGWSDRLKGGRADKRRPSDFDQGALRRGIKHELEHTSDRRLAAEIAMDHLEEHPNYYDVLPGAEKKMRRLSRSRSAKRRRPGKRKR